jgi:hypothetical protein
MLIGLFSQVQHIAEAVLLSELEVDHMLGYRLLYKFAVEQQRLVVDILAEKRSTFVGVEWC